MLICYPWNCQKKTISHYCPFNLVVQWVNVGTLQLWRQIIHGRSEELIPETQLEILVVHVLNITDHRVICWSKANTAISLRLFVIRCHMAAESKSKFLTEKNKFASLLNNFPCS